MEDWGIKDAGERLLEVNERRWLGLRSSTMAGSSSREFIDVQRTSSSSEPGTLHPPTPSKSRSIPPLPYIPSPLLSGALGVIDPPLD